MVIIIRKRKIIYNLRSISRKNNWSCNNFILQISKYRNIRVYMVMQFLSILNAIYIAKKNWSTQCILCTKLQVRRVYSPKTSFRFFRLKILSWTHHIITHQKWFTISFIGKDLPHHNEKWNVILTFFFLHCNFQHLIVQHW